jgi:CheY-like chemotaxis protein
LFVRASSADEALLALVRHDFAALVLDIRMPGMSGTIRAADQTAEAVAARADPVSDRAPVNDEDVL